MTRHAHRRFTASLVLTFGLAACGGESSRTASDSSAATRTAAARPQLAKGDMLLSNTVVWTPLIDADMSQWRGWKSDTLPTGWAVAGDVLSKDGPIGDLESRAMYANFELEFDWQVSTLGNAGVFYRTTEEYDKPYWSAPEYQLRDDELDPSDKNLLLAAGAAYAVYGPPAGVVKPAGEWNSARIVASGNFVEHWLNGQQVVQYQLTSADWTERVKASKFVEYPNYGLAKRGFLSIQGDHSGKLSIRAMRIRELP